MARFPPTALAALLLALPGGALAQFRTTPMLVRLPYTESDVLAGRLAASGGDGLLVLQQGQVQAEVRPWRDLLRVDPSSFPVGWAASRRYRSGHLSQAGADALVDVATPISTGVGVVFGSDPGTVRTYTTSSGTFGDSVASFLRVLPKTPSAFGRVPDVLVVPVALADPFSRVMAVDFDGAAAPTASDRWWATPNVTVPTSVGWHEAFPVRVSAPARSAGIDDVAVGVFGGVLLLAHASVPAAATLASVDFAPPVLVGGYVPGLRPPWLPQTAGAQADALGVTALDVNLDGDVDLVFTNATAFGVSPPNGALLWVEGDGIPADFGDPALTPWRDLGIDPALQLVDPLIVRGLELGGEASFAVWDRDLQEVVVATPDPASGLRVWRAPAPGQRAVDIFLADLVGSTAPDLVVVMANPASRDAVLVYADEGDLPPGLDWAPGSPGAPLRGVDHAMAVDASDDDGPAPRVDWFVGDPYATPAAQGTAYTVPGDSLCGAPPQEIAVTVRATDDLGVFSELSATLPVGLLSPSVTVLNAQPPDRLDLPPGGTSLVLDGRAARGCGAAITWGGSWPAGATIVDEVQGSTVRRTVTLPEATYPELLAGTPVVTLSTSEAVPAPTATLTLALDATGLVEVMHEADRPVIAEGEIAVLRTRLKSRMGVPLARVSVVDLLSGLAPAGDPRVSGASVVEVRGDGTEVLIEPLPAGPAKVEIELPVSSLGGRGSSVVQVRSSGGHLLTPAVRPVGEDEVAVGCGCGASSGGELALLALLVLVRPRRRPT
jgi:hypothetical protein